MDSALSKNLNNRSSIDQMIDQIETYRNTKISKKQKKSIAERVKLRSWKRKKKMTGNTKYNDYIFCISTTKAPKKFATF